MKSLVVSRKWLVAAVAALSIVHGLWSIDAVAADLTITAANVAAGASDTTIRNVRAGETLTAGIPVYRNTSDNEYYKCDADTSATTAACAGITLSAGSDGTQIVIATAGKIKVGATVTIGTQYFVSDTAGGICPGADLDSGDYISSLGTVVASDEILLDINNTAAQKP